MELASTINFLSKEDTQELAPGFFIPFILVSMPFFFINGLPAPGIRLFGFVN
jgi:hypothetical protein